MPDLINLTNVRLTEENARAVINLMVERGFDEPGDFEGAGYVMCAGGRYEKIAYASCRHILKRWPDAKIQVWTGQNEHSPRFWDVMNEIGVRVCVGRVNGGWPLKSHAAQRCGFEKVVFLDADCVPLLPMERLLAASRETGALLFPDIGPQRKDSWAWHFVGVSLDRVPEMEAGQYVIDRKRHWEAIQFFDWLNQQHQMFYRHLHGEKDLAALAMARLAHDFTMGGKPTAEPWGLRHYLPDGTACFDHRISAKGNKPAHYSDEISEYEAEYGSLVSGNPA